MKDRVQFAISVACDMLFSANECRTYSAFRIATDLFRR